MGEIARPWQAAEIVGFQDRIPARRSLRKIRQVVNDVLASLTPDFESIYVHFARTSIGP